MGTVGHRFSLSGPKKLISKISNSKNYFKTLHKGVFIISLFGLFLGASTTMIYNQLPMFMKYELHVSTSKIALVDGLVEFLSYLVRALSGAASDFLRNKKFILLLGSIIILLTKPLYALAKSATTVMLALSIDRIGNGFQASPRDALIASLSNTRTRGQSFGFSRSLKTIGSWFGTLLAISMMYFIGNCRTVFIYSVIPVIISMICLYYIKSPKNQETTTKRFKNPFKYKHLKSMDIIFWKLIILALILELGHFTEHLLVIRAHDFIGKNYAGAIGMFVSMGQVICSYSIGLGADKFGRKLFILICMAMMIIADILLMNSISIITVFVGAFLWGGQMTAIQGLFLSVISDKVSGHLIGTAIGIYYLTTGTAFMIASIVAGHLWNNFGSSSAYMYSICCVLSGLILFQFLYPRTTINQMSSSEV